jgi:non-ribosomal peptide synthetase component F
VDGDTNLSYGALNERANRLAWSLLHRLDVASRQGAEADATSPLDGQRVGLLMARSASFVVSLLAVLKLGAVYVPIDENAALGRYAVGIFVHHCIYCI